MARRAPGKTPLSRFLRRLFGTRETDADRGLHVVGHVPPGETKVRPPREDEPK